MKTLLTALLAFALWSGALWAQSAVTRVPYEPLAARLAEVIDFETFPKYMSPGQRLDGVQVFRGASFGERFQGQAVRAEDGFDVVWGNPFAPLTLAPGVPGENLAVTHYFYISNHLTGTAAPGYPENRAGGEGAIAILFDTDQSAVGFRVAGEPEPTESASAPGAMTVTFYRRDGVAITTLEVVLDWGRSGYGFERTGQISDIAGMTITNRDPAGIAIDDVIFAVAQVTG